MMNEDAKSDFNKWRPIQTPFPKNIDDLAITMRTSQVLFTKPVDKDNETNTVTQLWINK